VSEEAEKKKENSAFRSQPSGLFVYLRIGNGGRKKLKIKSEVDLERGAGT